MRRNQQGLTLIEILVVVAIVAMMMGMGVGLFKGSRSAQLKSEARHLASAVKYAYHQAAVRKLPYRIVFNLSEEEQGYWIEEGTESSFSLSKTADLQEENPAPAPESEESTDESESEDATAPAPSAEGFGEEMETAVRKVKLGGEVKIRDVYVAHQLEPVREGKAFLYFFPGGFTERAFINLTDENEEMFMAVIVNPVTGSSKVIPEEVSYETLQSE